jgi:hypothetical protein
MLDAPISAIPVAPVGHGLIADAKIAGHIGDPLA